MSTTRPARTYNPFALIQTNPDPWQGLVRKEPDGFLVFQNNIFGVRAGIINLVNQITLRNRTTLNEIIPIYAPAGHGGNNPAKYIQFLSDFMKVKPDQKLTLDNIYELGRGIITLERGSMISLLEYNEGFILGMEKFKNKYSADKVVEVVKKNAKPLGLLLTLALVAGIYLKFR